MAGGEIVGRWLFSHEENRARVYRERGGQFPPSRRPRDGFDINADGTYRACTPGATDASEGVNGRWTRAADDRIEIALEDGRERVLEIVEAAAGTLKVRA